MLQASSVFLSNIDFPVCNELAYQIAMIVQPGLSVPMGCIPDA